MDGDGLTLIAGHPEIPRRLLSVEDYHRMGEAGIFSEEDRVELVEGELVAMAPLGSEHVAAVNALNRLLVFGVGDRAFVSPQNPVQLGLRSEPQPDFAILRPQVHGYRPALPGPEDVLLAVEIAGSSLVYDRGVKLALYAKHGIPEVWTVDLAASEVQVHRAPSTEGYRWSNRVGRAGMLDIKALPGICIPVDDIFE